MLHRVRKRTLVLVMIVTLMMGGCWNRREIETLGFVTAVGVDSAVECDKLMMTVHIVKPGALMGPEATGTGEKPFWLVSSTGHTMFEAVRNVLTRSPRRPFWAHNEFVLFGEEFARGGIVDAIDFFDRDGETRRTALVVIAKDASASNLLMTEFEQHPMPAEAAAGIVQAVQRGLSAVAVTNINEFIVALETEGMNPVATRAEIVPISKNDDIRGELLREEVASTARITGAAVFKEDRLIGWLNQPETRGLLWVMGDVESAILVVKNPTDETSFVGLEVLRASAGVHPQIRDEKISIKITVTAEANIGDVRSFHEPLENPETWVTMERRMATVIRNEIASAIAAAQDLNSDVFGFGAAVNRQNPALWRKVGADWDTIFPTLDVEIEVNARIRRSGVVLRTQRINP